MPTTESRTERPGQFGTLLPPAIYVDPTEHKDVVEIRAILEKTGAGLTASMSADRVTHEQGGRMAIITHARLEKVRLDPYKIKGVDTGALTRVEIWFAETMSVVEPTTAITKILRDQEKRNAEADEERKGIMQMFEQVEAEEREKAAAMQEQADEDGDD